MAISSNDGPNTWLDRLDPYGCLRVLLHRRTRLVAAWLVAVVIASYTSWMAWYSCADAGRGDGNWGHCNIDFGGQWLVAALFMSGEASHLYDRDTQKQFLEKAFPESGEKADQKGHDADNLLGWLTYKKDTSLSGPLYPPVYGLVLAPLGLLPPQPAYRVMQGLSLVLTILSGWLIERLTRGAIWMPVAVVLVIFYPGYGGGFFLGQNPILTMTIVLAGWLLLCNERPFCGGLVWGLLAFKPVWAVAFFLVPLLTRRWRFAAGMALMGGGLALATLPFTGIQPWRDWLELGSIAGQNYAEMRRWIFLSRDLIGIPRRWMLTFSDDGEWVTGDRFALSPDVFGVALWIAVPLLTAMLALWKWKQREPAPLHGPGAAFVIIGMYFSCYHFMYYDTLLSVLAVVLLFMRPLSYWEQIWRRVWWSPVLVRQGAEYTLKHEGYLRFRQWRFPLPLLALAVLLLMQPIAGYFDPAHLYPPYDTFALLVLWAWCGVQWALGVDHFGPSAAAEHTKKEPVASHAIQPSSEVTGVSL
jgi:arabinofuranan 3-O-arabinosyltransferase